MVEIVLPKRLKATEKENSPLFGGDKKEINET